MSKRFEWDRGNMLKSVTKHGISNYEAETCFYDANAIYSNDKANSIGEKRYICIGKSLLGTIVFNIYTYRGKKIRLISSRPANKKERSLYENQR